MENENNVKSIRIANREACVQLSDSEEQNKHNSKDFVCSEHKINVLLTTKWKLTNSLIVRDHAGAQKNVVCVKLDYFYMT